MKQYIAYLRISDVKQRDGVSLEAQRADIEGYASRKGISISKWVSENLTAAKKGRPLFNELIKEVQRGTAQGIIFHKVDRSTRNYGDWDIIHELAENGVQIYFAVDDIDFNTLAGQLAADIQVVFATQYVRNLRQESIKGQRGRLQQGLYPYAAPLGYRNHGKGKPKTICPRKGPLVQTLFKLYATGNYSYLTLAKEMNKRGLRNDRGGPISTTGVEHIIVNPFYTGIIRIKRTGQTYKGVHKPLISQYLFQQADDVRTGRKRRSMNTVHNYRFRGLFRCGYCDQAMIGERQKAYVYYRCHRKGCDTKSIRQELIESSLQTHMQSVSLSEKQAQTIRKRFIDWLDASDHLRLVKQAPIEIAKIRERLSSLTDKFVDDLIDADTYKEKKYQLIAEEQEWEEKAAGLQQKEWYLKKVDELLERVKNLYFHYVSVVPDQKRDLVRFAGSNFLVRGKKVYIEPPQWHFTLQNIMKGVLCGQDTLEDRTLAEIEKILFD